MTSVIDEKPLPGRSKKVRIDNPKSTDLSELDFNFSNNNNHQTNGGGYNVLEKKILTPKEISKNLHDDVVAKQNMIERLINEADEYALHRRLAALQQQLLSNAKSFAQQISNLKFSIFSYGIPWNS